MNQEAIKNGIAHWEENTCIQFQETSNTDQSHIRFVYGDRCSSGFGKLPRHGQNVTLGYGCDSVSKNIMIAMTVRILFLLVIMWLKNVLFNCVHYEMITLFSLVILINIKLLN